MFISRKTRGPDPWLRAKIALFALAAVAFLLAVRLEWSWLVWVAIGLVLAGFLLRFGRPASQDEDVADDS